MTIAAVETGHYRIPLPVVLSDSTHGDIAHFDLVTARVRTADGGGGRRLHLHGRRRAPRPSGRSSATSCRSSLGQDAERIEALWQRMWWGCHYVGRGGLAAFAIAAADIALWDLRARRRGLPLWKLLGGHQPRVKAYAGGIDLQFPLDAAAPPDRREPRPGLPRDQDEGRPPASPRGRASASARCGRHLGPDVPLMVDANMRWTADEAIRAARALAAHDVFWLEEPTIPDDVPGTSGSSARAALPVAAGENLRTIHEFKRLIDAGGRHVPRARRLERRAA